MRKCAAKNPEAMRERIGGAIAYDVPWHDQYGIKTIMRCGGSVLLTDDRDRTWSVRVEPHEVPEGR